MASRARRPAAIIARAINSRDELRHFEEAIPGARIVVCRLRARVSTLEARLRLREKARMLNRTLPMRAGWRLSSRASARRTSLWILTSGPLPQRHLKSWTARAGRSLRR
jgi:hypothetical protein